MKSIWILTREENQYDQYGEYFEAVYSLKPTHQQLTEVGIPTNHLRHVLNGGGRVNDENTWYHLKEHILD